MISFIERVFIHTNIKNKVMIKNSMLLLLLLLLFKQWILLLLTVFFSEPPYTKKKPPNFKILNFICIFLLKI